MSLSLYADAFLKRTDELLTNIFAAPASDDELSPNEYIPPPPSYPPPPNTLNNAIEEGLEEDEDDDDAIEENDLVYGGSRPVTVMSQRHQDVGRSEAILNLNKLAEGNTNKKITINHPSTVSHTSCSTNTVDSSHSQQRQHQHQHQQVSSSSAPLSNTSTNNDTSVNNNNKTNITNNVFVNVHARSSSRASSHLQPPYNNIHSSNNNSNSNNHASTNNNNNNGQSDASSAWGGSRAYSDASSLWSSSSFTSQAGRLSKILLPSYPVFERDWLVEPIGMEPVRRCKVNKSSLLREVLLLDERRILRLRKKLLASKLLRIFDWLQSALGGEHANGDSWLVLHFCEVLDLLQCIDVCCVVVDMVRMLRLFQYDTEDIVVVMASALSCMEHVLGTRSGTKMGALERGYVAILQVYLSHSWLLDNFVPLSEWHLQLFRGFCDRPMLKATMLRLWGLRDFRLGVNEKDVESKSQMLRKREDISKWTDEFIQAEATRISQLPPVQLLSLGSATPNPSLVHSNIPPGNI